MVLPSLHWLNHFRHKLEHIKVEPCKFCNMEFKTEKGLQKHKMVCKKNPVRLLLKGTRNCVILILFHDRMCWPRSMQGCQQKVPLQQISPRSGDPCARSAAPPSPPAAGGFNIRSTRTESLSLTSATNATRISSKRLDLRSIKRSKLLLEESNLTQIA